MMKKMVKKKKKKMMMMMESVALNEAKALFCLQETF